MDDTGLRWTKLMKTPGALATSAGQAEYLHVRGRMNQIENILAGHKPGMVVVDKPHDSSKVLPATRTMLGVRGCLESEAPFAVAGFDLGLLDQDCAQAMFYESASKVDNEHSEAMTALFTRSLDSIYERVTIIHGRLATKDPSGYSYTLREGITPLNELVSGSALLGAQNRVHNDKMKEEGAAAALEKLHQAGGAPTPPTPPTATPASGPPPPPSTPAGTPGTPATPAPKGHGHTKTRL